MNAFINKLFLSSGMGTFLYVFPYFLIALWFIYAIAVFFSPNFRRRFCNYYIFESIPSVFVTIGLFGTFLGITCGLFHFDTNPDNIKTSIHGLLEGLKMAFMTSILGIALSMIFGKMIKFKTGSGIVKEPDSEETYILKQINDSINDNNKLLNRKFDEFTGKLAQSNSDALISGMKGVIEDFNDTFKKFIQELVNKNFEKLTESIDSLIIWQNEYKVQITELTKTNKDLAKKQRDFTENTEHWIQILQSINDENGKLSVLIQNLEKVIVDDPRFKKIINQIEGAASNLKSVSDQINGTSMLVSDVTKAFNQTEGKISTWLERESGVQESVLTLSNAITQLRSLQVKNISDLDNAFISRLHNTFQNFDGLIKEYISYLENKNYNENEAA